MRYLGSVIVIFILVIVIVVLLYIRNLYNRTKNKNIFPKKI